MHNIPALSFNFQVSIELKNISKRFGKTVALDDVSFSVGDGELVALLGPSGGGKTTVLRLIAGLEIPDGGSILIGGAPVNDLPAPQRNIGFVFQNYALFKNMTVFKNIAFGLKIKKWDAARIQARVTELIDLLELQKLEKRYPHELSGGPAPAGGHRARPGRAIRRPVAGRTVRGGGRPNPPGTAPMARPAASGIETDHHLRHPRPGGGDGSGGPDRHFLQGPAGTNRHAPASL